MKLYYVTAINSGTWFDGRESDTTISRKKADVFSEAWRFYENINTEYMDIIETDFMDQETFEKTLEKYGGVHIQMPDRHIQFEYFETEL